jgi:hypothetical protein
MRRRHVQLWVLLAVVAVLAGCADTVSIVAVYGGPREYIDKANVFLATAVTLFGQGPVFWGQALRSSYYSALTLARTKRFRTPIKKDQHFHELVWQQSPLTARRYFKDTLRKVRGRHDYDIVLPAGTTAMDDIRAFASKSPPAFEALLDEVTEVVERAYDQCTNAKASCDACRFEAAAGCARDATRAGITAYRKQYVKLIRDSQVATSATGTIDDGEQAGEG